MRRKLVKYMGAGFGAVGVLILIGSLWSLISGEAGGAFGILFGGIWTFAGLYSYARIRKFEERNFEWFRRTHPNSCGDNGRISCPSCNAHKIQVRGLMQHSYTREHFCGACGTTLYYTPEG
jgi:hypothetical protein